MGNASNALKDFLWSFKKNRKAQITLLVIVILILIVAVVLVSFSFFQRSEDTDSHSQLVNTDNGQEELYRRYFDGKYVSLDKVNPYPIAVMVENLVNVRPQSGLSGAGVVYEALAEGGITRFMLIYPGAIAQAEIGPVRSARPYFVDFADEYQALYAHAGGSPQALSKIPSTDIYSINQIGGYHGYYWRDITKSAPHNLFTSSELLARAMRDLGLETNEDFRPWKFKDDESDPVVSISSINIDYSTYSYEVEWRYDLNANLYVRYNGGEKQIDKNNDQDISAKNILIQKTQTGILDESARLDITTTGSGEAILFQDGGQIDGTWRKDGERTIFFDNAGDEIRLNSGQTWVEIVKTNTPITVN